VEAFPVGRSVAFDAEKGRLWAVCRKCCRWNLAPLEERWEPVEDAERLFRDARLRAQSENIGLARLRDGTRLIRVGEALQGELAAWRYGDTLVRRRRQYLMVAGAAVVGGIAVAGGIAWAGVGGAMFAQAGNLVNVVRALRERRVFHEVPGERSPTGSPLELRRWHLKKAVIMPGDAGSIALSIPHALEKQEQVGRRKQAPDPHPIELADEEARRVLARGAVHFNAAGANRTDVAQALDVLTQAGTAETYLRNLSREGRTLKPEQRKSFQRQDKQAALRPAELLALEMALHEEEERRALQGELVLLRSAWKEAEEIADVADRLLLPDFGDSDRG
jgi:hypothetical protein